MLAAQALVAQALVVLAWRAQPHGRLSFPLDQQLQKLRAAATKPTDQCEDPPRIPSRELWTTSQIQTQMPMDPQLQKLAPRAPQLHAQPAENTSAWPLATCRWAT